MNDWLWCIEDYIEYGAYVGIVILSLYGCYTQWKVHKWLDRLEGAVKEDLANFRRNYKP